MCFINLTQLGDFQTSLHVLKIFFLKIFFLVPIGCPLHFPESVSNSISGENLRRCSIIKS